MRGATSWVLAVLLFGAPAVVGAQPDAGVRERGASPGAAETERGSARRPGAEPGSDAESEAGARAGAESEPESEPGSGAESETEPETEPGSETEPETDRDAEAGAETDPSTAGQDSRGREPEPMQPPPSPWEDQGPEPEVEHIEDEDDGDDEDAEEGSGDAREAGQPPSIPRREIPNYDNRPERGATAEEVLLWIPRILFFPVHLVLEYVVRAPIGWLLTTAERENWQIVLTDFFTWDEQKAGLVPTALFDFGFQPSVGLYFWWNDFLFDDNYFRAQIGFGGVDWLRASVSDRVQMTEETELSVSVDAWRRPDYVFHGLGYDSVQAQRSRFLLSYVEGRVDFRFRPWRASEIRFVNAVRWNDFSAQGYAFGSDDPSLEEAVTEQGWYDVPPGFEGYTSYTQRLSVAVDSREERPAPGHGIRVQGFVEQGFDLTDVVDNRWLRYGGAAGAFLDVGNNRIFGLWGLVRFADPLGSQPVPFLEQVTLGGDPLIMSGFLTNQLIGRSAAVMTLEYRYPIWVFLDGSLHFSMGNVFDEHLSNFDVERLRMSFGFGLRSIGDRDQSFNVLLAFGTSPIDAGASIDNVRIVFGSQQGF